MAEPELGIDPVIVPVGVPNVQVKELEAVAVRVIFVLSPLHIVFEVEVVMTGIGLTVTVMEVGLPTQPAAVGVTIYITDPAFELLVLLSV
jgi:hypothetical protein